MKFSYNTLRGLPLKAVLLICAILSLPIGKAYATDQSDLSTALQTLPLMNNKIIGEAVMAVIYNPADSSSKADADSVMAALGSGYDAPGVKVTGQLVAVADAGAKLSASKLVFIAKGACTDAVAKASAAAGALSLTTDMDCVKNNKSILGVSSSPNVEVYYSKVASDAASIGFARAFTMLVKKI